MSGHLQNIGEILKRLDITLPVASDSGKWAKAGPRVSEGDLGEAGAICATNKTRANQAAGSRLAGKRKDRPQ